MTTTPWHEQGVAELGRALAAGEVSAQDLARRKPSEIDHLNGYILRRGEALGIPTPSNRLLHTLIRLIEPGHGAAAGAPAV